MDTPIAVDQFGFSWNTQLWPRPAGRTDKKYFGEPVHGAWWFRAGAAIRPGSV